jgi:hypothetical protein
MIGIAITTHNRNDTFNNSYDIIKKLAPKDCVLVVVDDASDIPVQEADYRFAENVGIAAAKNKCLELLYLAGCSHFFLFDDDTYPLKPDWHLNYINSGENHLMYIFQDFSTGNKLNDTTIVYKDSKIVAYSHPRGCMLYFTKKCLDVAGGMNTAFGRWGWEHVNLSDRIYNMGLTAFPYMDIANSKGIFHAADEHRQVQSTVPNAERKAIIEKNLAIYNNLKFDATYFPFFDKKAPALNERDLIVTCYFSAIKDPQRNVHFKVDKSPLEALINSCNYEMLVLNDCFENSKERHVEFLRVETHSNPYFQRWISYYKYLLNHPEVTRVFFIDGTDVEILRNPFEVLTGDYLYVGFEPGNLNNEWMVKNHPAEFIIEFLSSNKNLQLVNAGILGGKRELVMMFIRTFLKLYYENIQAVFQKQSQSVGTTDMGLFNYTCYRYFNSFLMFGREVCTSFKAEEKNQVSVFKHK